MTTNAEATPIGQRIHKLGRGVSAGFTARSNGGVSVPPFARLNLGNGVGDDPVAVARNRELAARGFGISPDSVTWMSQVHGRDVAVVDTPGNAGQVDAMVTSRPGVALAVLVADCLPVLVADADAGVVGAAHSGRPGTAANISGALIDEMTRQGANPEHCVALLGPSVCGRCYEVPGDLRDEMKRVTPEGACVTRWGSPGVDIRAAVVAQLRVARVAEIGHDERCTREDDTLFSYRRDATTGRFAGYVWRDAA